MQFIKNSPILSNTFKIFGIFSLFAMMSSIQVAPLQNARTLFTKLDKGVVYVDSLISVTAKYSSSPVMLAYNGAAHTAKAKYLGNVFSKYSQAKKGLGIMDKAVQKSPKNVEVRFVRYCTESNIPSVMPFTSHVEQDKTFIINNLKKDHAHYQAIKNFLLKYGDLSAEEKKKLSS